MRSPVYALIWEQWRQLRVVFALCVLAMTAIIVIPEAVFSQSMGGKGMALLSCNAICWFFLCAALLVDRSRDSYSLVLPRRMYTLPVSRAKLALVEYLFRLVSFTAAASVLAWIMHFYPEYKDYGGNGWYGLGLLFCVASSITAAAWTFGSRSLLTGIVGIFAVCIPLLYAVLQGAYALYNYVYWHYFEEYYKQQLSIHAEEPHYMSLDALNACIMVGIFVVASAIALVSICRVSFARGIHPHVSRSLTHLKRGREYGLGGAFGFELRNSFAWYPAMAAAVTLLYFLSSLTEVDFLFVWRIRHWCEEEAPGILLLSALATGLFIMAYDHRKGATQTMLYTRPVSTASLACSRFQVSLVSVLTVVGFWSALFQFTSLGAGNAFNPVIPWIAMILGLVAVTLMWVPIQALFVGTWYALAGAVFATIYSPDAVPMNSLAVFLIFVWVPCSAYALRFYAVFRRVNRNRLMNRSLIRTTLYCCLISIALVVLGYALMDELPQDVTWWPTASYVWIVCTVATLPGYALLSHTLWLDKVRHGQSILGRQLFLAHRAEA